MPRVKISDATTQIASLVTAISTTVTFTEYEIDQLCVRLEIDPFQLRELFVRALAPAEDIPVENEAMPPAWYDNNVQLSRLLLELNDVLELSRSQWEAMLSGAQVQDDNLAGLFEEARAQVLQGAIKYKLG